MRQTNQKVIYGQVPGGTQKQSQLINQYVGGQSTQQNEVKQSSRLNGNTLQKTSSHTRGASQSQNNQSVIGTTSNLGQGHVKTKSTQLTYLPNGLQNILQDNTYPAHSGASGGQMTESQLKVISKHTRHISGPTVGNVPAQSQLYSQPQTAVVSNPGTISTIQQNSTNVSRTKQATSGTISVNHNRTNSNKFTVSKEKIAANSAQQNDNQKIQKLIDNYQEKIDQSHINNQSAATDKIGHKKSVSMANSKITQLLLKAGYGQQNAQQQKAPKIPQPEEKKNKTKIQTQKAKLKGQESILQSSDNYLNKQAQNEMLKNDGFNAGYIQHKSSDFTVNQIQSFAIPNVIHDAEDEIQRILTFDERELNTLQTRQDLNYNEIMRMSQNSQKNAQNYEKSSSVERSFAQSKQQASKPVFSKQAQQQKQQLLLTPIQMMVGAQKVMAPKESIGATYGVEKIQNQSKIVSSGAAVKKPNSHKLNVKTQGVSSLGARSSVIGQPSDINVNQSMNMDLSAGVVVSVNHQRTKSDQLSIQKAINNFGGNIIQLQQKKVGEILKNNFLDSAQSSNLLNGSASSGNNGFSNVGTTNTTAVNPKSIKSFAMHEQSTLTTVTQNSQLTKKNKQSTTMKVQKQTIENEVLQNVLKSQSRKTTKDKYNELKQQYNDLAQKYQQALQAAQTNGLSTLEQQNNQNRSATAGQILVNQKNDVKSSLSSLSGQTLSSNNVLAIQQAGSQNQINQRVVRYIHKQQNNQEANISSFRIMGTSQDNNQNIQIRVENKFETWGETNSITNDAQVHQKYQVINPAPMHTNAETIQKLETMNVKDVRSYTGPNASKQKEGKLIELAQQRLQNDQLPLSIQKAHRTNYLNSGDQNLSSDPKYQKQKANAIQFTVESQPQKLILSNREHILDEQSLRLSQGVAKQRQIVTSKQKNLIQRQEVVSRTPESSGRSTNQSLGVLPKFIKPCEAVTNIVDNHSNKQKLELSSRHRRSVSDGNEPSTQLKFGQNIIQRSMLLQKDIDHESANLKQSGNPVFHKIVGFEMVASMSGLPDDVIKTINPPPSTHALHVQWEKNQQKNWEVDNCVDNVARPESRKIIKGSIQPQQKESIEQQIALNSLNQLRANHNRLKSDDVPSKKRIKSNSIYLVNQPNIQTTNNMHGKYDNPSNEGSVQTPTLDTHVKSFLTDVRPGNLVPIPNQIQDQASPQCKETQKNQTFGTKKQRKGPNKKQSQKTDMPQNQMVILENSPLSNAKTQEQFLFVKQSYDQNHSRDNKLAKSNQNVPVNQPDFIHKFAINQAYSHTLEQIPEIFKPQVNNLLFGQNKKTIESDTKYVPNSSSRTAKSSEDEMKERKMKSQSQGRVSKIRNTSDCREQKVQLPQQMLVNRPSQKPQSQPLSHPIIQPQGVGFSNLVTHHQKNKLSNNSDSYKQLNANTAHGLYNIEKQNLKQAKGGDQKTDEQISNTQKKSTQNYLGNSSIKQDKIRAMSISDKKQNSNHKRVKSDTVESRQTKILQMIVPTNNFPSVSFKNLPVKERGQNEYENDRISPHLITDQQKPYEGTSFANIAQIQNANNFFIGSNTLDGTDDNRKLVNVSIDLINEDGQGSDLVVDDLHGNGYYQGGQWYEVQQFEGKEISQMAQEQLVLQFNQHRVIQDKNDLANDPNILPSGRAKRQQETSQNAIQSKSAERGHFQVKISDVKPNSDVLRLEKYKNMLLKAKNKFQSKSEIPKQIVIQDDFQMNEADSEQFFMNSNQLKQHSPHLTPNQRTKETKNSNQNLHQNRESFEDNPNHQVVQRDPEPQKQQNINMIITSKIGIEKTKQNMGPYEQVPPKVHSTFISEKEIKITESGEQLMKYRKATLDNSKNAQKQPIVNKQPKQDMFVPTNSVDISVEDKEDELNQSAHNINLIMGQQIDEEFIGDRLQTQDSIANDPTLSPREKIIKKLTRYISKNYLTSENCPQSTIDFYRIGKVLGKGAFGKVNLALHHLTKRMVAIKSINKSYFNEEAQSTKVKQEVVILKQTRHRNIVRLYEYFETQKHILFVIEICAGGDLLNYVRKRRQLKEDVAKSVFKQLIEGIGYCHSKNILHRDIKLDNILLAWNGEVKICDFGVSKVVRKGEIMTEQCGTPAYIAPEILIDKGYEGFSVDIWSAGVVLYAMLYGTVPFKANNMSELQKIIIKASYQLQDCISKEARNLLEGLLEKDPSKRLTVKQILKHPWMKDAKDNVELFTSAEQNYIKNEYTYANTDRYNRNEPDNFMDGALDTERNSVLKNAETKSIILAPFNSTKSHIESQMSLESEIKNLMESRSKIFFVGKVREIDKQYEVNNNADLDNGVYHDFGKDEDEKPKDNLEELKMDENKQTELEKLENMIRQEESDNNFTHGSDEKPYECGDEEGIPNTKQLQPSNSKKLMSKGFEANEAEYLICGLIPDNQKVLMQANTLTIGKFEFLEYFDQNLDIKIVDQVEQFGFKADRLIKYLNNNELNSATTCYFLMCQPDIREECRKLEERKALVGHSASASSLGQKV